MEVISVKLEESLRAFPHIRGAVNAQEGVIRVTLGRRVKQKKLGELDEPGVCQRFQVSAPLTKAVGIGEEQLRRDIAMIMACLIADFPEYQLIFDGLCQGEYLYQLRLHTRDLVLSTAEGDIGASPSLKS